MNTKKFQVNHASVAEGPHGSFGNLLVNPLGHSEDPRVTKVTIRVSPETAKLVNEKLKEAKEANLVLTVTTEFQPVAFPNGDLGLREESWKDKVTGEARSQWSVYYRMVSGVTPEWAKEKGRNEEGNLGAI
jgi:hypothetical protein